MFENKQRGFTLIEILIVVAMIAILSAAILVSISSQRDKARKSRVIVELSGVIQPMMMCWSDGGTINNPPGNICDLDLAYGTWPSISDSNWSYDNQDFTSSGDWYIQAKSDTDEYICCNSAYDRCADMGTNNGCDESTILP